LIVSDAILYFAIIFSGAWGLANRGGVSAVAMDHPNGRTLSLTQEQYQEIQ
jgi:hypothetical protein